MTRLVLLLGVLGSVAATVSAGSALANHSGPEYRTYGHGRTEAFSGRLVREFDFSARLTEEELHEGLLGEPHGHMKVVTTLATFPEPTVVTVVAEVTCLTVVGSRAMIGGKITRFESTNEATVNTNRGLLFDVADNTFVGTGNVSPDQFGVDFVPEAPQVCPAPTSSGLSITEGDIVVEQN